MRQAQEFSNVPIVDVSELVAGTPGQAAAAGQLGRACAQDAETKMRIRMALGGRAWRGYFRVGDELTSGKPDQKEGLYFGTELFPELRQTAL